jgi:hypothetical protein
MRLESVKNDFFKIANDLNQNSNPKKQDTKNIAKYTFSDYEENKLSFVSSCQITLSDYSRIHHKHSLLTAPHISPEQPPELI